MQGLRGLPAGGGHLEGVRLGGGVVRDGRGHPDPGRDGLYEGRRPREGYARPQDLQDLRGHQRHPQALHRSHGLVVTEIGCKL